MPIQAPERGESSLISYVEFNTDITINSTTEAGANVVVTAASITTNGADIYFVEFFSPSVQTGATLGNQVRAAIFDNGAPLFAGTSTIGIIVAPAASFTVTPFICKVRVQPVAGAHVYSIRGWRTGADGIINGSNGGITRPGYISVTRVP